MKKSKLTQLEKLKNIYLQEVKTFLKEFINNMMNEERKIYLQNTLDDKGNGYYERDLLTAYGKIEDLEVPRVRSGRFYPKILPYRNRAWFDIREIVYAMHMTGSSVRDIQGFIQRVYRTYYSADAISRLTEVAEESIEKWKSRPLKEGYAVIMIDSIFVKLRRGEVKNEPIYIVLGIDYQGYKEILGFYLFGSETESSYAWKKILEDLKYRGVKEVEVFVSDNLCGIVEATRSVYPKSKHQLCVLHQVRNNLLYVRNKDKSEIIEDMKKIYQARNKEEAEKSFLMLKQKWQKIYPKVVESWHRNLFYLLTMYDFPSTLRRYIYTTNQLERINKEIRRRTKVIEVITGEKTLNKILYYVITDLNDKFKERRLPSFVKYYGESKKHN